MKNEHIHSALDWRYAVKKFDPSRKIEDRDWATIETALIQTPSSFGLQPYKFLVIETPELRARLREVSWNQSQVTDASKFVVLLSRRTVDDGFIQGYIQRISNVRGLPVENLKGFQDMMSGFAKNLGGEALGWARRQTYIALGFLIETAALLGIDATPMEGFDAKAYDQILGLENSEWTTSVVAAVGYRHSEDETQSYKKVRREKSDIVQYR